MLTHRVHDRSTAAPLVREVAAWDAVAVYVSGLHAGDIGWALRLPDEALAGALHGWWEGERLAAVVMFDGQASVRPRVAPERARDPGTAAAVVELVESLVGSHAQPRLWSDADAGTRLRQELVVRGWDLDPDPWVSLYRDLTRADEAPTAPPTTSRAASPPAQRVREVDLRRSGLAADGCRSRLPPRARPGRRDRRRSPAAVATAWSSVPGWGHAVVVAACAAAQKAGASGISVATPPSNEPAVAAYHSAGFRPVETLHALTRAA